MTYTFDDILLVPQYSEINSRQDVNIVNMSKNGKLIMQLPIFSANMDTITEYEMANYMHSKGGLGVLHRFNTVEENVEQFKKTNGNSFVSIGTSDKEVERFFALKDAGAKYFCVDVAHGHSAATAKTVNNIKKNIKDAVIMAGNVATYDGAMFLYNAGADLVKVGIGPGSVCTTRIKTGHGVPQLYAISECAKAPVTIVADGGLRTPGDIVKALAFGADFVMIGSMLAGSYYTPGETFYTENPGPNGIIKKYRGMASKEVAYDKLGGLSEWKTAEGVSVEVPYKGPSETDEIIHNIIGGLRSALTYSGCTSIKELQIKKQFVTITNSTLIENSAHRTRI